MRITLFLLLLLPAVLHAQINRSATELAKENIQQYVTSKLFSGHQYQPVSYGELKLREEKNQEVIWSITHKFEIAQTETHADKKISVQKPYNFIFYLDKKMKVRGAESYYLE
jgi:hypothetical protein